MIKKLLLAFCGIAFCLVSFAQVTCDRCGIALLESEPLIPHDSILNAIRDARKLHDILIIRSSGDYTQTSHHQRLFYDGKWHYQTNSGVCDLKDEQLQDLVSNTKLIDSLNLLVVCRMRSSNQRINYFFFRSGAIVASISSNCELGSMAVQTDNRDALNILDFFKNTENALTSIKLKSKR